MSIDRPSHLRNVPNAARAAVMTVLLISGCERIGERVGAGMMPPNEPVAGQVETKEAREAREAEEKAQADQEAEHSKNLNKALAIAVEAYEKNIAHIKFYNNLIQVFEYMRDGNGNPEKALEAYNKFPEDSEERLRFQTLKIDEKVIRSEKFSAERLEFEIISLKALRKYPTQFATDYLRKIKDLAKLGAEAPEELPLVGDTLDSD